MHPLIKEISPGGASIFPTTWDRLPKKEERHGRLRIQYNLELELHNVVIAFGYSKDIGLVARAGIVFKMSLDLPAIHKNRIS